MTVDNCILYLWPHFLSADCRKSRSSLFSMYHDFSVEPGTGPVLLGEVSQCNDDNTDNRFIPHSFAAGYSLHSSR